jgi:hypothetical protein
MRAPNRDLFVLLNEGKMTPEEFEHEVDVLNSILFKAESFDNIFTAHELIDLNKYKVYSDRHILLREIRKKTPTPFVFFFNKN